MKREDLLTILNDLEVTSEEIKKVAKEAGYSGADGGVQGLKKYLSAETISTDDKNISTILLMTIGYGRLRYLCVKNKIILQYQDYIKFYIQEIQEIEKNLDKMSFGDARKILQTLNEVVDKHKI